jgi:hypothetical protein
MQFIETVASRALTIVMKEIKRWWWGRSCYEPCQTDEQRIRLHEEMNWSLCETCTQLSLVMEDLLVRGGVKVKLSPGLTKYHAMKTSYT